jgi:two-component system nitrate/nitrite response regulator NarL
MNSIRVVLVDEHPAILHGLTRLLRDTSDLEVTATTCSAAEAIEAVRSDPPDVIVVGLSMQPAGTGLALVRRFSHAPMNIRVLAFGDTDDPDVRRKAAYSGAVGLLSRSAGLDVIVAAIRRSSRAGSDFVLFDEGSVSADRSSDAMHIEGPGAARVRMLNYVSAGLSNRRIAMLEGVSERTVKRRMSALYERLGATHRAGAVAAAMQRGLI